MTTTLDARVRDAETLSPTLRRFVLEPAADGRFPVAAPGAHVVVLTGGERRLRRAYSITSLPPDRRTMQFIVRRTERSRGGSDFLHDAVAVGDVLRIGVPQNLFPVPTQARGHVLLSAGIGVTPFLAYLPALAGTRTRLHHFCRPAETGVFRSLLAGFGEHATIHAGRADLAPLLAGHGLGTHVSVCGPEAFMASVAAAALAAGFPPAKIHRESFGVAASGAPFIAILARQGRRVAVASDVSLLEALEEAGLDPPSLCRERGFAASAGSPVPDGPILTCVARADGPELVLDI